MAAPTKQANRLATSEIQDHHIPRRTTARWKRRRILEESSDATMIQHRPISLDTCLRASDIPKSTAIRWKKRKISNDLHGSLNELDYEQNYHSHAHFSDAADNEQDFDNEIQISEHETENAQNLNNIANLLNAASHYQNSDDELQESAHKIDNERNSANISTDADYDQDSESEENNSTLDTDNEFSENLANAMDDDLDSDNEQYNIRDSDTHENEQYKSDLLLLALKLRHKLSGAAISDFLKLCNFVSGKQTVSKTAYFFNRQFSSVTSSFVFYYLCGSCGSYVRDERSLPNCRKLRCTNAQCNNNDVKKRNKSTFFVYLSVKEQLKDLLENHNIDNNIIDTSKRVKKVVDNFEDIFDGELYKAAMPVADCSRLSISFNSDGVPVFRSSQCSIWPILCVLNELPPNLRKEHVMLAALWFGGSKPIMNSFLEPFVQEMQELEEDGFCWIRSNDKMEIRTKVKTLVGVCDSVARPAVQGFTQFNGRYGCSFCYDCGSRVAQGDGYTRVYPYDPTSALRTPESTLQLVEQAMIHKEPVLGVKGPSVVDVLQGFNIIEGLVPDYMHAVILGVVRQLARLWFDSSNSNEVFYISLAKQRLIDLDLSAIQPPCNISRNPRSLTMRKFWKAHEWYMWLLYYSLPILKIYLARNIFMHYALLVDSISLLLSESISADALIHCDQVLTRFVIDFQNLYGLNNVSFNVHLCLHLTQSVRSWGPLWAHSAFVYESFNGNLLQMIRGTQAVPQQICRAFALHRAMPMFCTKATSDDCSDEYKDLLRSFQSSTSLVQNCITINGVKYLGRRRLRVLPTAHNLALHSILNYVRRDTVVSYYDRIITCDGEIIHSRRYCRDLLRNSYTVSLENESIFIIAEFVVGDFGDGADGYAIGFYYTCVPHVHLCNWYSTIKLELSHFLYVGRDMGRLAAVRVADIKRKCVFIQTRNNMFDIVCKQINVWEYCA